MTTKILTGYVGVLLTITAFALIGITFAYASEVTGTLSSDASQASLNNGILAGTVTSESGGGSSGGGGGGSSNRSSSNSNSSPGAVLGAATSNVAAPSFPNAGHPCDEVK